MKGVNHTVDIGFKLPAKILGGKFFDLSHHAKAGVSYDDIDGRKGLLRFSERIIELAAIGHIATDRQSLSALLSCPLR